MQFIQFQKSRQTYLVMGILLFVVYFVCAAVTLVGDQRNFAILLAAMGLLSAWVFWFSWRMERDKIICIDENGISLTVQGNGQWAFRWEEIETLTYSTYERRKSIRITPRDMAQAAAAGRCEFQLSKAAMAALTRHSPLAIQKK